MKRSGVVLCLLGYIAYSAAASDCLESYTSVECAEYTKTGGGRIVLDSFTDPSQFTDDQQAMFKVVVANVSDYYVIVDVEPEHVVITNIDVSAESGNKVTVHFFVVNPTGSIVMPVAIRSNELYLMLKLNKELMETMLEYEVTVLEPVGGTKLPIPTWALAIIIYVGLVVVVGLIYMGTKDIRHQWSEKQETKLRHAVMGDRDMEIGSADGTVQPGYRKEPNDNKPAEMYRDTQISFGVQVTKEDIAAALGITYATVEGNGDVSKAGSIDSPPPEKSEVPPAYHEATTRWEDGSEEASTSDKTAADATAALEGVVNAAYDGNGDSEGDQTTSL